MNKITSFAIYLVFVATAASAGTDPAAPCRAAYADDPPAHITCLETALRKSNEALAQMESATDQPTGQSSDPILHKEGTKTDAPTATATDQPTGLGADQVLQKERIEADAPAEQVTVLIVAAAYNAQGLGVFRLDNGQVWRETEKSPTHKRLQPDEHYQARIERARIGNYRMYVDGIRWMFKIERLK